MPVRDGFLGGVLHHAQTDVVIQFVHCHGVVFYFSGNAALEDGDGFGSTRGDFLGHQKAGPSTADDGNVDGFEVGHVRTLPSLPCSSSVYPVTFEVRMSRCQLASEQPEPDELCGDSVNVLAAACLSASGSDYHDRHDAPFHAIDNPVALSHCADA